jgi:hypothetical protein
VAKAEQVVRLEMSLQEAEILWGLLSDDPGDLSGGLWVALGRALGKEEVDA